MMKTVPLSLSRDLLLLIGLSLILVGCGGGDSSTPLGTGGWEPVDETVELVLMARNLGEQPLSVDVRGVTTVAVGEEFLLELIRLDGEHMVTIDALAR